MKTFVVLVVVLLLCLEVNAQIAVPTPAAKIFAWVISEQANIRESSSSTSRVLATAKMNDLIVLVSTVHRNGWYQVKGPTAGWIQGNAIRIDPLEELSKLSTPKETAPKLVPPKCSYVMTVGSKDSSGYRLYFQWSSYQKRYDVAEVWTCVEPLNPVTFRKLSKLPTTFVYGLQFMSVDCDRSRFSADRLIPYTRTGQPIPNRTLIWTSVISEPIVPDSIGEEIKSRLCKE